MCNKPTIIKHTYTLQRSAKEGSVSLIMDAFPHCIANERRFYYTGIFYSVCRYDYNTHAHAHTHTHARTHMHITQSQTCTPMESRGQGAPLLGWLCMAMDLTKVIFSLHVVNVGQDGKFGKGHADGKVGCQPREGETPYHSCRKSQHL